MPKFSNVNANNFNVNGFLTSEKLEIIRTNRYVANITFKEKTLNHILCESVEFPENGISTTEYQINNKPMFLIPYSRNYGGNTISVIFRENILKTNTPEIIPFFETWLDNIAPKDLTNGTYHIPYYRDVLGGLRLKVFGAGAGENSFAPFTLNVYNIYPTMVRPSQMEYGDLNNYMKVTVTFAFEEFEFIT